MSKLNLIENIDYYFEEREGMKYKVFTEHYLSNKGYCCQNKCRHCPYGFTNKNKQNGTDKPRAI